MAVDIDLYHCEIDELKEHIEDIRHVGITKLEFYIKEMMDLIDEQKAKDKKDGNYILLHYIHYIYHYIKEDIL